MGPSNVQQWFKSKHKEKHITTLKCEIYKNHNYFMAHCGNSQGDFQKNKHAHKNTNVPKIEFVPSPNLFNTMGVKHNGIPMPAHTAKMATAALRLLDIKSGKRTLSKMRGGKKKTRAKITATLAHDIIPPKKSNHTCGWCATELYAAVQKKTHNDRGTRNHFCRGGQGTRNTFGVALGGARPCQWQEVARSDGKRLLSISVSPQYLLTSRGNHPLLLCLQSLEDTSG